MGAHILLTSEDNFQVCIERGVYGCVMPAKEWNRAEVIAGILSVQPDDLVFFYVKNRGIYGLWKAVGEPFFDETQIWADDRQMFPFRITFEPAVGHFANPVSLTDVLELHDKGLVWAFDLNPVQRKNQYKITMAEARELLRLLLRNNPVRHPPQAIPNPYVPTKRDRIRVELGGVGGRVRYEGWLNAWFVQSLAKGELRDLLGDYREFLNLVPTTFNKVMDLFLTHVTTVDSIDVLHKYTCIELKVDRASDKDLAQLLRYEDMLARKLAAGDRDMIQPILVARRFADDVMDYAQNRRRIEEKVVRLIAYQVSDGRRIELREVSPT
ncbi:MAG TPA: EVE domain-containing protein [Anaerolineae bacterium]|nr:EVE domain-containing protein [Anaerolineae bacterium]